MKELGIKKAIKDTAFVIWHLAQRSFWPLLGGDIEGLFSIDPQDSHPSEDFDPRAVDSSSNPPEFENR